MWTKLNIRHDAEVDGKVVSTTYLVIAEKPANPLFITNGYFTQCTYI